MNPLLTGRGIVPERSTVTRGAGRRAAGVSRLMPCPEVKSVREIDQRAHAHRWPICCDDGGSHRNRWEVVSAIARLTERSQSRGKRPLAHKKARGSCEPRALISFSQPGRLATAAATAAIVTGGGVAA